MGFSDLFTKLYINFFLAYTKLYLHVLNRVFNYITYELIKFYLKAYSLSVVSSEVKLSMSFNLSSSSYHSFVARNLKLLWPECVLKTRTS